MARKLMPKSGAMAPYVVVNRDAAVAGVFAVDGEAGSIDLTTKYVQIAEYTEDKTQSDQKIQDNTDAIASNTEAIQSHTTIIQSHTEAIQSNTETIQSHSEEIQENTNNIQANTEALTTKVDSQTLVEKGLIPFSTSLANFDWQTNIFTQGGLYNVNCSNWLNAPPGLPTTSIALIEAVAVHNTEGANRRLVLRISQIVQSPTRRMWEVVGYGPVGSRTWTVEEHLTFNSTSAGRAKLAFDQMGIGITALPIQSNVNWQTAEIVSMSVGVLNAANWTNAPAGLPATGSVVVFVLSLTASQAKLEVTELLNSTTNRKWIVHVNNIASTGSRTFFVQRILTTDDTGTTGAKVPLLSTANTWGAAQTVKSPIVLASDAPGSPSGGQLINSPVMRTRINGRGANGDPLGEKGDIFIQESVGNYVALTFNISAFSDNKFWSMNASTGETFSPLGILAVQGSDVRIKYNFTQPKTGAWKRIQSIGICEYMYNGSTIPQRGFLAQQMGEVDDMYVFESSIPTGEDEDGNVFNILNVNDRAVMADMITVMQQMQERIIELEEKLSSLTDK